MVLDWFQEVLYKAIKLIAPHWFSILVVCVIAAGRAAIEERDSHSGDIRKMDSVASQENRSLGENLIVIIVSSLLGGGIVTMVYEFIKDQRENRTRLRLFRMEMEHNKVALENSPLGDLLFDSVYKAHGANLVSGDSDNARVLIGFYGTLPVLWEMKWVGVSEEDIQRHCSDLLKEANAILDILDIVEKQQDYRDRKWTLRGATSVLLLVCYWYWFLK